MSDNFRPLLLTEDEAQGLKNLLKKASEQEEEADNKKDDGWTKEKILAEKNMLKRQRLIAEHWELFKH
jgi:hypothetical protein